MKSINTTSNASNDSSSHISHAINGSNSSAYGAEAVPTEFSYSFTRDLPRSDGTCTETRWVRRWGSSPSSNSAKIDGAVHSLTIMGSNFATTQNSASLRVGFSSTRATDWLSDTSVQARQVFLASTCAQHCIMRANCAHRLSQCSTD
jgi:hypothetical protein